MKTLHLEFVYNRKNKLTKDGTALIQLRVYFDYKPARYCSTGQYVTPNQWDNSKRKVKNHPSSTKINSYLSAITLKANEFYLDNVITNPRLSAIDVCNHLKNKGNSFIEFTEEHINNKVKAFKEKKEGALSTIAQHRVLLRYLKSFNLKLRHNEIDYTFINRFESFLIKQKNDRTGNPLSTNYIASLLVILRGVINIARGKELIKIDPYLNFTIKRIKKAANYLEYEELKKIEEINISKRRGQIPLSYEVFLCSNYTGLRFSCLYGGKDPEQGLRVRHIRKLKGSYRLQKTLFKNRKRHPVKVDIPLDKLDALFEGKLLKIILKHIKGKKPDDLVFGSIDNGSYNKHVRIFLELAKVNKVIKGHQARDSFAQCLADLGVPLKIIGQILGHSTIKTTEIYANKVNRKLVDSSLVNLKSSDR